MVCFANLGYGEDRFVPGEIIVKHKIGVTDGITIIKELGKEFNINEIERVFKGTNRTIYRIRFQQDVDIQMVANRYRVNPHIEYAHPNYILNKAVIPNDEHYGEQWALDKISAPLAWDIEQGTSSTIIAVPDTGVDLSHPDLVTNIWVNDEEIDGVDNDGNGYIDDKMGWNFVNGDNNPMDDNGHGSTIAGVISAMTNNSIGIAGVSWYGKIMAIKCLDKDGKGNVVNVSQAIEYAVNNGAKVINMSWGSYEDIPLLKEAVDYAAQQGCVLVGAAGNDNTTAIFYPAGYGSVTAVCAVNNEDKKTSFSNYGDGIDVSAPGDNILTTTWDNSYTCVDGTSIATGFVSGLAGLILSQHPTWNKDKVYQKIIATTDNIDNLNPGYEGLLESGRINLYNAIIVAKIKVSPTSGTIGSIVTVSGEGFGQTEEVVIDFGVNPTIAVTMTDNLGQFKTVFTVDTQPAGVKTIIAKGMISFGVATATFTIISLEPLPDLIVTGISFHPLSPVELGRRVKIKAFITNQGDTLARTITIRFYDGENRIGQDRMIKHLNPGKTSSAMMQWDATLPLGTHTIRVVVDPDNKIKEINENNNEGSSTLTVILPPNKGAIAGTVTDKATNSPIRGALVIAQGRGFGIAETDRGGKYIISNLKPGTYTMIVFKFGYWPQIRKTTVKPAKITCENFSLLRCGVRPTVSSDESESFGFDQILPLFSIVWDGVEPDKIQSAPESLSKDTRINFEVLMAAGLVWNWGNMETEKWEELQEKRLEVEKGSNRLSLTSADVPLEQGFEVKIIADKVEDLMGAHIKLCFDPKSIEVVSIDKGDSLAKNGGSELFTTIDNLEGSLELSTLIIGGEPISVTGSGVIATIRCKTRATSLSSSIT